MAEETYRFERDPKELVDKSACAGSRADLKLCLLETDCCQIEKKTPRQCILEGKAPQCMALKNTFYECKRSLLDNRARFRGHKGY
ncbi:hypothetical protein WDU94_000885 [Cyamophila willieti]